MPFWVRPAIRPSFGLAVVDQYGVREMGDPVAHVSATFNKFPIPPDATFWVGKGGYEPSSFTLEFEYYVYNPSQTAVSDFYWVCVLYRNGVKKLVQPATLVPSLGAWGHVQTTPFPFVYPDNDDAGEAIHYEAQTLAISPFGAPPGWTSANKIATLRFWVIGAPA